MNRAPNEARPGKKQILHFKWRQWILKIRCKYKIIYDIINVTWRVKTRFPAAEGNRITYRMNSVLPGKWVSGCNLRYPSMEYQSDKR